MIVARIHVRLKKGILDPQGKTVQHGLENLGIKNIEEVRMGKLIEITYHDATLEQARELSEDACRKFLSNPIIEEYEIELIES